MSEVSTFPDPHGVEVAYRRWDVPDPVGCVVISHGASEHSGRYARFAHALNTSGFAVYAPDHRGHGLTVAATGAGRVGPPGGGALVDDLDAVFDIAASEHPDVPCSLFGHSMGSLIALAYATTHPERVAVLALCGLPAPVEGLDAMAAGITAIPDELREQTGPALTGYNTPFEPARTSYDWLTRDPAEVDAYIADELCGDDVPLTLGFTADLFSVVRPAFTSEALARITSPVLIIAGDQDPAAGMGEHSRQLRDALKSVGVPVTSRLYAGARHELLNETNRDEVTTDITRWLHDNLTP